jgi:hypothetical protein
MQSLWKYKFIDGVVILELSFVTLSVLVLWKGYSKALCACIPLALLVVTGNSLVRHKCSSHDEVFQLVNAIVLIVGGYVLQIALIYSSLRSILNIRSKRLTATP